MRLTCSRFFYGDERTPEGGPMSPPIGAEAHSEFYLKLATEETDVPWDATFVAGKGYVDFTNEKK
jgi:hypothetical protein